MEKRTSCPFSRRGRGSAFRSQYCRPEEEVVVGVVVVGVVVVGLVVRERLVGGSCKEVNHGHGKL